MGWISDGHMRCGGSLYEGGPKRKGPLRKVVSTKRHQESIFQAARVVLECGHEADSWGGVRAVCTECGKREALKAYVVKVRTHLGDGRGRKWGKWVVVTRTSLEGAVHAHRDAARHCVDMAKADGLVRECAVFRGRARVDVSSLPGGAG